MKTWLTPIAALALAAAPAPLGQAAAEKKVYVVPVREDIMPPILYVIRRGVKEAMAAKADCLILRPAGSPPAEPGTRVTILPL